MTLVFGQQFIFGVTLMADSRTSLGGEPWRDNVQKIYRLSSHMYIGFAGDIDFASNILAFVFDSIEKNPKLKSPTVFAYKGPKIIRYAYNVMVRERGEERAVEFVVAGRDFNRPARDSSGIILGVAIYDTHLFTIQFPGYKIKKTNLHDSFVAIGSGSVAVMAEKGWLDGLQDNMSRIQYDLTIHVTHIALQERIKKLGIDTVGGMYQIIVIDDMGGSGFTPYQMASEHYSGEIDCEMVLDSSGKRFIQRNLKTGKEMPLLYVHEVLQIIGRSRELFAYT